MSVVSLLDVKILNNPAPFNAPYEFEITFEALEGLQKDLEWKLTYVGSAQSYVHASPVISLLFETDTKFLVARSMIKLSTR